MRGHYKCKNFEFRAKNIVGGRVKVTNVLQTGYTENLILNPVEG